MTHNKGRKSIHSHKEKYLKNKKNKKNKNNAVLIQQQEQYEENIDESDRKHKCKKNEFENMSFLEGLMLLLLIKEIGLIDNDIEIDDYKEADVKTKATENIVNQKDINENHETVQEKKKSNFDMDLYNNELVDQE